jgi:hypothetical protein
LVVKVVVVPVAAEQEEEVVLLRVVKVEVDLIMGAEVSLPVKEETPRR